MSDYNLEYYKYLKYKSKYLELLNIYNELYGGKDERCDSAKETFYYRIINDKLYFCRKAFYIQAIYLCDWNYLVEKKTVKTRDITITYNLKNDVIYLTIKFPKELLKNYFEINKVIYYNHPAYIKTIESKHGAEVDTISWNGSIAGNRIILAKNKKTKKILYGCSSNNLPTFRVYKDLENEYYLDTNYTNNTNNRRCNVHYSYEVIDNRLFLMVISKLIDDMAKSYLRFGMYLCDWDYLVHKKNITVNSIKILYQEDNDEIKLTIYNPPTITPAITKMNLSKTDESSIHDVYLFPEPSTWGHAGQTFSFVKEKDKLATCTWKGK